MNDKLLRDFIEASGFEIKEVKLSYYKGAFEGLGTAFIDEIIDYKLTKKKPQVCFDVDSPEWSCIVNFILNQAGDIEHDIEGYGDLKPMLDYFNRNSQ